MNHSEQDRAHLSRTELVDALDGTLDPGRRRHLRGCEACRLQLAALADVVADATDVEIPEPSPLLWEHLAGRVRTAIDREPIALRQQGIWWPTLRHMATLGATAAVLLVVVVGSSILQRSERPPQVTGAAPPVEVSGSDGLEPPDLADLPADWALLLTVADTVDWEDADTDLLLGDSDAVDVLVSELSDEEQRTLVQLIEVEMEQAGL